MRYSMWNAPSDLDYYDQTREPPEPEGEPEPDYAMLPLWYIGVRVGPGIVRAMYASAATVGEACEHAEAMMRLRYRDICATVSTRRVHD